MTLGTTITNAICGADDGIINLTGNGGIGPYTYLWNTTPAQTTVAATNLAAGTYAVTVTDSNNCTATIAATVNEENPMTLTTSTTDATCNVWNGSATVVVSGGAALIFMSGTLYLFRKLLLLQLIQYQIPTP